MFRALFASIVATALILVVPAFGAAPSPAARDLIPSPYKRCSQLNAKYPHGVGKTTAKDKTKSGDPVTTFKRSTRIYNVAISHNKRLDADKDGIACEKH